MLRPTIRLMSFLLILLMLLLYIHPCLLMLCIFVTYLRADVKVTSGTGSASDPYILSIE